MEKRCACCGRIIEKDESYFKCLENFLQVKFFDSEDDNIFCSRECFCEQLFLEEINSQFMNIERDAEPAPEEI